MTPHDLPESFRRIDLTLAREPGHPVGDTSHGFTLVAPLDAEGALDADAWREHRAACRVVRRHDNEVDAVGQLEHGPGGLWSFRYGDAGEDKAHHLELEHFTVGEYVSVREPDGVHTFRVDRVAAL
ncbi:MAG TPA: hypothetical protein VF459_16975 [Caulobacteraceae bacterium]